MTSTFLTLEELAILTGRKMKSKQIKTLRLMGLPFFINATGHPVVARSTVDPMAKQADLSKPRWIPAVLRK